MIQVTITRNSQVTNQAAFDSQEEADTWLNNHLSMGTFGSPALYQDIQVLVSEEVRGETKIQVKPAQIDEFGEEITPAIFKTDPDGVISPAVWETQTVLVRPAEYTIEITDITSQLEQEAANLAAKQFLDSTDWIVIRAIERGEELSSEFKAQRETARNSIIK